MGGGGTRVRITPMCVFTECMSLFAAVNWERTPEGHWRLISSCWYWRWQFQCWTNKSITRKRSKQTKEMNEPPTSKCTSRWKGNYILRSSSRDIINTHLDFGFTPVKDMLPWTCMSLSLWVCLYGFRAQRSQTLESTLQAYNIKKSLDRSIMIRCENGKPTL